MTRLLVFGATSAIAEATARLIAEEGGELMLLARDRERLATLSRDLSIAGASRIQHAHFDALDYAGHAALLDEILQDFSPQLVLLAWGALPDQVACEQDAAAARQALEVNGLSVISLLTELVPRLQGQGPACIAIIGSPAGLRGRAANHVYGAGKAMLPVFAEGLRARLDGSGLHVMTVIPGRVDTPMTAQFDKGPLWAAPEQVARALLRGAQRRRRVVYAPGYWRWILLIIQLLPERLLRRLKA